MNFKVLLIKPNILARKGFTSRGMMIPPIGLAYIAQSLIDIGCDTSIIDMVAENPDNYWPLNETHDFWGMGDDALLKRIGKLKPDLIGIGGFTNQFGRIRDIAKIIKKRYGKLKIVIGGVHATGLPRHTLENIDADYLIIGDGEKPMTDLVTALHGGDMTVVESIDGLCWKKNGSTIINQRKYFNNDIDELPWPGRALFNHTQYKAHNVPMPLITSRSCPLRCTFCGAHTISGKKWRGRSPVDVADEVEYVVKRLGYKSVAFYDDAANVISERLVLICEEIARRKLDFRLTIPSGLIIKYITEELLLGLKKLGVIGIALSIEHSDEQMRNNVIKKKVSMEKIEKVIDLCEKHKLLALGNFVIGMPGETETTLQRLLTFIREKSKKFSNISVFVATPFPGTEFYNQCLANGLIEDPAKNDFLDLDTYTPSISLKGLPLDTLLQYKNEMERTFQMVRGPDYPSERIREIFRKPNDKGARYVEKCYFAD